MISQETRTWIHVTALRGSGVQFFNIRELRKIKHVANTRWEGRPPPKRNSITATPPKQVTKVTS
jgi:hypothetical protein